MMIDSNDDEEDTKKDHLSGSQAMTKKKNDDDEDTKNDHLSGSQAGPHGGREREHGAAQEAGAEDPRAGVQVGAGEDHQAEAGHTSGQAEGGERQVDITRSYQNTYVTWQGHVNV